MKQAERGRTYRVVYAAFVIAALFVVAGRVREIEAQHGEDPGVQISANNWGRVTAPVFGTSESGVYAGAELFAGPNKFGTYFSGVLPNGKIVKPAGTSIQVGMNPLGLAITSDGKYLGLIPTPRGVISVAFAGSDKKTLYVVSSGAEDANGQPIREGPQQTAATIYKLPMIAQGVKGRAK